MLFRSIQLARQVGQVKYHSTNGKNTTTEVVKAELQDVRIERKKVISNGNTHTVYVLLSIKRGEVPELFIRS